VSEVPASGKGRPTPKRRDAQRRSGGPVAPPPTTRKEAAKRIRAQGAEKRKAVRTGTRAGDERAFLARDQGPVRRLVRDLVDSRRHVGVLLLPATFLPVLANLSTSIQVRALATSLWLAAVLAAIFDMVLTGAVIRRRVRADFPEEAKTRGHVGYGLIRTAQFRRFRVPPPQVRPGAQV
jgi:hypothetical protein